MALHRQAERWPIGIICLLLVLWEPSAFVLHLLSSVNLPSVYTVIRFLSISLNIRRKVIVIPCVYCRHPKHSHFLYPPHPNLSFPSSREDVSHTS